MFGFWALTAAGVDQGSPRTQYQLQRECRELGLALEDGAMQQVNVDLGAILEECLESDAWTRRSAPSNSRSNSRSGADTCTLIQPKLHPSGW